MSQPTPKRRSRRLRSLLGFILVSLGVIGAARVGSEEVMPAFGWEIPGGPEQVSYACLFVALFALFVIVVRSWRPLVFSEIRWAVAIPAGLALAIYIFWALLELRSELGFRPRDQVTTVLSTSAATEERDGPAADDAAAVEPSPEERHPMGAYLLAVFLDNGWFQPAVVSCFTITLFALLLKVFRLRGESAANRGAIVQKAEWPEGHFTVDEAQSLLERIRETNGLHRLRETALVRRVERMLERVDNTKSSAGVDELMNSLSAIDADASSSSFGGVAFLIYLMPVIGFLGTIFGVGQAIFGFSLVIPQASDFVSISPELTKITYQLGVAFDTTLSALVLSALGGLVMTVVRQYEEKVVGQVDNDCVELFRSLTHEDPGTKQIVQAIDRLSGTAYRREFQALAQQLEKDMEAMSQAVKETRGEFQPLMEALKQASMSLQETGKQLRETSGAIAEDSKTTVTTASQLQDLQQHMTDETKRLIDSLAQAGSLAGEELKRTADRMSKELGVGFDKLSRALEKELESRMGRIAKIVQSEANALTDLVRHLKSVSDGAQQLDKKISRLKHLDAIAGALENVVRQGVRAQLVSADGATREARVELPSRRFPWWPFGR